MTKKKNKVGSPRPTKPFDARKRFIERSFWLLGKHGRIAILVGGTVACTWILSGALKAFAGKQSVADLRFGIFADIRIVYTVSMAVGAAGVGLYLNERRLHRKTRERLATRITGLEKQVDPARTSSLLTSLGLTRQEDE